MSKPIHNNNRTEMTKTKFQVSYDEKRCGYFVKGHGFDFFLYFTTGDTLECDSVMREGSDFELHLTIPIGQTKPSSDLVETLVARELNTVLGLFQ